MNEVKVRSAIRNFLVAMKAHDESIPEELAQDAMEMVEEVNDAMKDESPDVLEITKDEDPEEKAKDECLEAKVKDGVIKALKEIGLYKDPAMKALDELEITEDEDDPEITEDADNEESVTVDPEKMKDSMAFVKMMKPVIAQIKNPKQRKKAADALAKLVKMNSNVANSQYGQVMSFAKKNASDSANKNNVSDVDFGMHLARLYNPHYKEDK